MEKTPPVIASPAPSAVTAPAPKGRFGQVPGENLLPANGLRGFAPIGDPALLELSYRKVQGQPFSESLVANVKNVAQNPWDLQIQAKTPKNVEKGDLLLATFYVRTEWSRDESGEGQVEFVFELARDPWTKSASMAVRAAREWKKVNVPFVAAESLAAGEAQINFRVGFAPQKVEIAGLTLENFKKQLTLADLPVTKLSYRGMEPDAPWRALAEQRIEQIRRGNLRLRVKDKAGKPVSGASVELKQVRQAFGFGSCVPAALLTEPGHDQFKQVVSELFNVATLENDFKWQPLSGDWGSSFTIDRAKAGVTWLRERDLGVRGHVLVWPSWRNSPRSLQALEKKPDQLRAEVKRHIRELVTAAKGSLLHWDVVNEPFDNHDLLDILGPKVMIEWFKEAHAIDPAAKLFINDYAILSGGGGDTPHRDSYEKTIQMLIDGGAPLDGIGMQGHFGTSLTGPEDILKILDRFAKFKKTIYVTEYDLVLDDEELGGKFSRDFYTTLFSHPAVGGIVMWGFWDGSHWKKNAPMYREDWSLKPSGAAIRELLLKTWRTHETGTTDAQGVYAVRGFLGDYSIVVNAAGKQKTVSAILKPPQTELTISLD